MSKEEDQKAPKIVALEVIEKNGVDIKRLQELIT